MSYYALKVVGKRSWYCYWSLSGPRFTAKRNLCQRFKSREDAKQHPTNTWPSVDVQVRKYKGPVDS